MFTITKISVAWCCVLKVNYRQVTFSIHTKAAVKTTCAPYPGGVSFVILSRDTFGGGHTTRCTQSGRRLTNPNLPPKYTGIADTFYCTFEVNRPLLESHCLVGSFTLFRGEGVGFNDLPSSMAAAGRAASLDSVPENYKRSCT